MTDTKSKTNNDPTALTQSDIPLYRRKQKMSIFYAACLAHRHDPGRLLREAIDSIPAGIVHHSKSPAQMAALIESMPEMYLGDDVAGTIHKLKVMASEHTMQAVLVVSLLAKLLADIGLALPFDVDPQHGSVIRDAPRVQAVNREPCPPIKGKMPTTSSGKNAVKAAWEIECEEHRQATPLEVMARLRAWGKAGVGDELLDSDKLPSGLSPSVTAELKNGAIPWQTRRGVRAFSLEACEKTLERWHKSRQQADIGDIG